MWTGRPGLLPGRGGGVGYHLDDGVFKYCRWVCFDRFHLAGFKN